MKFNLTLFKLKSFEATEKIKATFPYESLQAPEEYEAAILAMLSAAVSLIGVQTGDTTDARELGAIAVRTRKFIHTCLTTQNPERN